MRQYLDLLDHILTNGARKEDRTDTGTLSVFGYQMRFNLAEGFPLVTTKRLHLRSIIYELLWFLQGDTNIKYLNKNGVKIWNEWADDEGELGPIYSQQWTAWEVEPTPVLIKPRIKIVNGEVKHLNFALEEPGSRTWLGSLVGEIFESANYGEYIVLDEDIKNSGRVCYTIQFLKTGYKKSGIRSDVVRQGNVKDPYYPAIHGIAYAGEYELKSELDKILRRSWGHMIDRCYNPNCKEYQYHGARGIYVDNRWLNFAVFREDAEKLPNWHKKRRHPELYQIDKDYYHANYYSRETCVWLSQPENMLYRTSRAFTVTTPQGEELVEISTAQVARNFGLSQSKIAAVLRGARPHHKKFKFKHLPDGHLYRYRLPVNQIQEVVEQIKTNPDSRRLVVSAWNVADLPAMRLSPCHCLFQFYVADGRLSCQLYQRSADVFLGVPFNIASYALLTHIMAQQCDLDVGEFVWTGGDTHLYVNHLEQARLQLTRDPFPHPQLVIKRRPATIFEYAYEDFEIAGYQAHPHIAAPVAV